MAAERQANQKRLLLTKHRMEDELDRMRVFSDFSRLQKMMDTSKKPGDAMGSTQRPQTE